MKMNKKYKTKFPVARIKKIMQLDEDVGKVAQSTPVLISKALELFMQTLLDESVGVAAAHHARKLHPGHMKAAIMATDKFDFLRDIASKVEDAPPASAAPLADGDEPKKRAVRKRKSDDAAAAE
ncbi:hypothetical protein H9P43_007806 [Blastocladiella emersonii ATCC 22665]|nr:hypothetical protein H9P43_007806 [Blastocladiella emersonii ATCC 22665]